MAESSSSTVALSSGVQKRKRKVLSIDTKLAILESLSKGVKELVRLNWQSNTELQSQTLRGVGRRSKSMLVL